MEIEQANGLGFRNLPRPIGVAVARAGDLAVLPDISRNQRADDRRSALGARLGNVFTQVPSKSVDGLSLAIFRLFTGTAQRACAAVIIVAELHDDDIARLEHC